MAKPMPPPLDVATILRLKTELESTYATQDIDIRANRLVRTMKDNVMSGMTNRYTDIVVRDNTMFDEIARNSSALALNPPQVTLTAAPGAPDPAEHSASMRSVFYEELLEDAQTKIEGQNQRDRVIDMALGDGGAYMKVLYSKELWEDAGAIRTRNKGENGAKYLASLEQAKKDAGQPIVMIAVDPLSFYPIRNGTKFVAGMEVQTRPVTSTLIEYGLGVDAEGNIVAALGQPMDKWQGYQMSLPTTLEWIEYWDEWRQYIVLNGIGKSGFMMEPWEHGYGRPPYFSAMGYMMGHESNRKCGHGIAESKRFLVQYSSFLKSTLADVAARDTYTPIIHVIGEDTASAMKMTKDNKPDFTEDFHVELRDIVRSYPGDDYKPWPVRDVAPALTQALAQNSADIQASLTPKVTSNIGGGLEGAGFAINTVLAEAKVLHHFYVSHLEQMYVDILNFIDYLIVNKIKDDIWLYIPPAEAGKAPKQASGWLSLGKKAVQTSAKKQVVLDPDRPSAKLIESQYHTTQVQAGMEGPDEAILAQGRDPDAVRLDIMRQKIRESDWYQAKVFQDVSQEMGYGHLLAMSKLAASVAQTGGLPGLAPLDQPAPNTQQPGQGNTTVLPPNIAGQMASPNQAPPDSAGTGLGGMREETPQAGATAAVPLGAI